MNPGREIVGWRSHASLVATTPEPIPHCMNGVGGPADELLVTLAGTSAGLARPGFQAEGLPVRAHTQSPPLPRRPVTSQG